MAADNVVDGKSKLEFDVNMTCGGCEAKVRESLQKIGVQNMVIDVDKQSVVVETEIPFTKVQEAIRSTGKVAVLKGYGPSTGQQLEYILMIHLCYVDNVNVITLSAVRNQYYTRINKCSIMTPIYENLVRSSCYYQDHDTHSSHSSRSHRSARGSTNGSTTNGLEETDLSCSVEEESYSSSANTGSGSHDVDSCDHRRPRSSRSSTMRRVWFEDCALLDDLIAQAAEREQPSPPKVENRNDGDQRSLAKEYLALDEMLRNLRTKCPRPNLVVRSGENCGRLVRGGAGAEIIYYDRAYKDDVCRAGNRGS